MPCSQHTIPNVSLGDVNLNLCFTERGSDVDVSMEVFNSVVSFEPYYDWVMELQRKDSSGKWQTIGSRSGYITESSPSHRTFTNIAHNSSAALKIYVKLYYSDGEYIKAVQSQYFYM